MSRIVDPSIFDEPHANVNRPSKYPYDLWTDGNARMLIRGEDWAEDIPLENFRIMVARAFRARGFQIRTRKIDDKTVVIQAVGEYAE